MASRKQIYTRYVVQKRITLTYINAFFLSYLSSHSCMAVPVDQGQEEVDGMDQATFANRFRVLSRRVTRNNPRDQTYNDSAHQ